jgi:hypothetical protein
VSQKPIVRNLIEAALDVAFKNPLRFCAFQCGEALYHRIGAASLLTESIRVSVSVRFHNWIESEQM